LNNGEKKSIVADSKYSSAIIQVGDRVEIKIAGLDPESALPFYFSSGAGSGAGIGQESPPNTFVVDSKGDVAIPIMGKIQLAGLNREEAEISITNKLKELIKTPVVQVRIFNFMVSVFDEESVELINSLNYKNFLKIPSGEITNLFLLKKINIKKNKVILSTGMSNYYEICDALNVLARKKVYECKNDKIIIRNYQTIKEIQEKIVIMHCISDYPSEKKDSNLRVINRMKNDFLLRVGFSDHSLGKEIALASVYAGAEFIEKHFTIDKKLKGPDHIASLNYLELKDLVKKIKLANLIMGSQKKKVQNCEKRNINIVRKFLVAKKNIFKNEKFTFSNLTCKRSSKGVSPMNLRKILGKKSKKRYLIDQLIEL
jgi:sialic acid synthase SpsE